MTKLISNFLQLAILAILLFNLGRPITVAELGGGNRAVSIHVMNGLPEESEAMTIECTFKGKSLGIEALGVGDEYSWSVEERARGVYFCEAIWGRQMGSWHAFQPRRDADHPTVFWLVNRTGFFLSWDNSTWIRRSTWESE